MEDNAIKEGGIVSVRQEIKSNETFLIVHVTHRGLPTDAVPHLPFLLTPTSRDELRSFLTTLGVNSYCSDFDSPVLPTAIRPCIELTACTVDDIMVWLTKSDGPLELILIAGNTSEGELKNRLKQWQETKQKASLLSLVR